MYRRTWANLYNQIYIFQERKSSYPSPSEISDSAFASELSVPELPPRNQLSNQQALQRPLLPPKKHLLPQLPLISSLNDNYSTCLKNVKVSGNNSIHSTIDAQDQRTLKRAKTAVSTPIPSSVGNSN